MASSPWRGRSSPELHQGKASAPSRRRNSHLQDVWEQVRTDCTADAIKYHGETCWFSVECPLWSTVAKLTDDSQHLVVQASIRRQEVRGGWIERRSVHAGDTAACFFDE